MGLEIQARPTAPRINARDVGMWRNGKFIRLDHILQTLLGDAEDKPAPEEPVEKPAEEPVSKPAPKKSGGKKAKAEATPPKQAKQE